MVTEAQSGNARFFRKITPVKLCTCIPYIPLRELFQYSPRPEIYLEYLHIASVRGKMQAPFTLEAQILACRDARATRWVGHVPASPGKTIVLPGQLCARPAWRPVDAASDPRPVRREDTLLRVSTFPREHRDKHPHGPTEPSGRAGSCGASNEAICQTLDVPLDKEREEPPPRPEGCE